MFELTSFGSLTIIAVLVMYSLVTAYRNIIKSSGSLRDHEKIHRYFVAVGGILAGWGLGSVQETSTEINFIGDAFLISLLLSIAGMIIIIYGATFLKSKLWSPLENISEYSAEFGTRFIATRLPETGGTELEQFSRRFNQNAINLANKISLLEIEVDKVDEALRGTVTSGTELTEASSDLGDLTINFSDSTTTQVEIVSEIGEQVTEFISWYDETKHLLRENFVELRSLSEMGNLIAINAAVEASNLEIPNAGFETLATKLRDLARSLESRQEVMKNLIDEVNNNYELFKNQIQLYLKQASDISNQSTDLGKEVDGIIRNIAEKDITFRDSYRTLERSLDNFKSNIPTAYS